MGSWPGSAVQCWSSGAEGQGTAALDEVPVFVRAGGVVPVAPLVQYTDALPAGPLEVQVYAGADGQFDVVEDDGISTDYVSGSIRKIMLSWNDNARRLSWTTSGQSGFKHSFTELFVTEFAPSGVKRSLIKAIGSSGSIDLP